MNKRTALILATSLGLAACSSATAEELRGSGAHEPKSIGAVESVDAVVERSGQLGYELIATQPEDKNVVVSPASLATAFSMLGLGASGAGVDEMTQMLGASPEEAADSVNALTTSLAQFDGDPGEFDTEVIPETPLFHNANRAVVDDGASVQQGYLDALVRSFDAEMGQTDFAQPSSLEYLSEWVNHHTAGLIPESAITPDASIRLVLQNAVLFGAAWASPFEEAHSTTRSFTALDGEAFDVEMLRDSAHVPYAETAGWTAIRLAYTDGFTATFVLPPEGTDPGTEEDVAHVVAELERLLDETQSERVEITLPKLDTEGTVDLVTALEDLGYHAIFAPGALNGIGEGLAVLQAMHQTVLRVDEAGTVAAAVTEIAAGDTAVQEQETPATFVADRPYLMVVNAPETGWDLFQAVIRDPRG